MIFLEESKVPSFSELYEKILAKKPYPLPGLEDAVNLAAAKRANRIHEYLLDRADRLDEKCDLCWDKSARKSQTRYAFNTPWEKEERELNFCSEEHADIFLYKEPFAYFWCDPCSREICRQNPANGWMVQYRTVEDEDICLSCYQDLLLEEGLEFEREKLERGEIPGMFFSWGNLEPRSTGYEEVSGYTDFHVNSREKAQEFIKEALRRLNGGQKVIVCYERLAYGGLEGYVTMMVKQ